MAESVDVIVVGGGISGLTAAYELKKKSPGLRLVVLEAQNRVGGRTLSVPLKSSNGTERWDLGKGLFNDVQSVRNLTRYYIKHISR